MKQLETMVAELVGVPYAFATTSATTALHLSLVALGIGPGDEVLVPDFTFPATANVVVQQGAAPVLVDIDLDSFTIDCEDRRAEDHASHQGDPAGPSVRAARRHGPHRRDRRSTTGSRSSRMPRARWAPRYHGRQVGGLGTAGCFSFHPRKSITTGEGGMIMTADGELAERIGLLRSHGGVREGGRFRFEAAGFNYRMSDILAAVGVAQMRKLDAFLAARAGSCGVVRPRPGGDRRSSAPVTPTGSTHTYQSYVVLLDEEIDRDDVIAALRAEGIETTIGTYALHDQPFFARTYDLRAGDRPRSHRAFTSSLALPLHGGMREDEVADVTDALTRAIGA